MERKKALDLIGMQSVVAETFTTYPWTWRSWPSEGLPVLKQDKITNWHMLFVSFPFRDIPTEGSHFHVSANIGRLRLIPQLIAYFFIAALQMNAREACLVQDGSRVVVYGDLEISTWQEETKKRQESSATIKD